MTTFIFWFMHIAYAFVLSYLVLGFIISFEVSAAMNGGRFAHRWIIKHFSYKEFYWCAIIFYPMLRLGYFFLEVLPSMLTREIHCQFDLDSLFNELFRHQ